MKTIKIICLFTFLFVALASCKKDEDGCYDLSDFGHEDQTVVDPSKNDMSVTEVPENQKPK